MPKIVLLLASILGLPLLSFAQTAPSSSQFYLGIGANLLTDAPFNTAATPHLVGPSLTAGIQLSPRLALQASAAYHWKKVSYDISPYYNSGSTPIGGGTNTYKYKYLTVPVLLRYTFTEPTARFHFDGLAGITVLYGHFNYTSTATYTTVPGGSSSYYPSDYSSSSTSAAVTLGPAVRYSLSPQVDLTANGLVSAIIGKDYYSFSDRLFLNVLVGAQYTFGQ